MDSTFIYPVTIHRGDASGSLTAGWTTSLPANMSNSDELVAVLYTSEGQFEQGLYLKQSNSRNWRYIVPYSAICQGIINGSAVDVYYNVTTADSGLPPSAKIWRNGIETDNPTFTVNDGAVYGALTVATGDGQVSSVNGVLPDSTGDVTIGIPQIPGLEAALAAAGSVKTVNNASPDVNGNVTVPVGTTTVAGTVKGGGNVAIAVDGTLSYSLPVAAISVLGGVKQGANVTIAGDGTISVAAPYTLPAATTTTLGGVIVGICGNDQRQRYVGKWSRGCRCTVCFGYHHRNIQRSRSWCYARRQRGTDNQLFGCADVGYNDSYREPPGIDTWCG
jgi:hypothetical protein